MVELGYMKGTKYQKNFYQILGRTHSDNIYTIFEK